MTAENTPAPDGPDPVDWDRLEAEIRGQDGAADAEDQDGTARVLVDSAEAQRPGRTTLAALRAAERRPIVPAWLRSAREARGVSLTRPSPPRRGRGRHGEAFLRVC